MTRSEFSGLAGVKVHASVYQRIETAYIESDKGEEAFVKSYGRKGIIGAYSAELTTANMKLSNLARRAVDSLERMRSAECCDVARWHMLDVKLTLACEVLGVERYQDDSVLKQKLFAYVIV